MNRLLSAALGLLVLSSTPAVARADAPAPAQAPTPVSYQAFLSQVAQANLELAAQRANVTIAAAQIATARTFPDPVLSAGIDTVDVSGKGAPLATTVGLSVPVELGGKRSARIAVAEAERAQVRSELDDALRALRATATNGFIDALLARLVLDRKLQSQKSLEQLVASNEERVRRGDIGSVALIQSRVEAQRFRSEVIAAETELTAARLALAVYMGSVKGRIDPAGELRIAPRTFDAEALIAKAKANRPDLLARRLATESASARVTLASANRWVDVTLNVGWKHTFGNPSSTGPLAGPTNDTLGATVSVPIPLSRAYRGELDAALAGRAQGETQVQAAELRVEVEVRQALSRYQAAVAKLGLYTGGLLADAEQVAGAVLYNYQRGGATLLEVLDAQRTVNSVYLSYYEALADHARALVTLEQTVGIWDVQL